MYFPVIIWIRIAQLLDMRLKIEVREVIILHNLIEPLYIYSGSSSCNSTELGWILLKFVLIWALEKESSAYFRNFLMVKIRDNWGFQF